MKTKNKPAAEAPIQRITTTGDSSRRHQVHFTQPSKTQQQFKESVNVNNIVRHYAQTGIDPYESRKKTMTFGSVPNVSYTQAKFYVAEVFSAFEKLPSWERASFSHDPQQWLDSMLYPSSAPPEIVAPESLQEPTAHATPAKPGFDQETT